MTRDLVTVIGGSGFIGRYVVRLLARQKHRIRVAVRHPNEALFLKPMGDVGQIQLLQTNIRNAASVARAVDGADAVVNLVGILQPSGHQDFQSTHVDGAETVAKAAAAAGVRRLVQLSAIGADRRSESAYARTKGEGEIAVRAAFPGAVILRPSIVFGPEDAFFNRFAGLATIPLLPLPLIGGGKTRFQPVYVCDVAEAITRAATLDGLAGQTYELGGPTIYSFREILELVQAEIQRDRMMLPVPFFAAKIAAFFTGLLPNAPLTMDQVELLKHDNVVDETAPTLRDLGIDPTPCESVVGSYLERYRRQGEFAKPAEAG
ncbi:complex I NDUFA9 subunit family protein [Emcibacter sp. SYSU 3D8]|uniref:complex I NDUFA9 subunit family protein n=1 Tax=Emcibacter sp. SYSU 3D8 TaxID=3133969 RepID=UPI0031FF382F